MRMKKKNESWKKATVKQRKLMMLKCGLTLREVERYYAPLHKDLPDELKAYINP